MADFDGNATVGQLVCERPARARLFEELGIDYCCGGRQPLARACAARGLDVDAVRRRIREGDDRAADATDEWIPRSMSALIDFIVATHHAYLRRELPRLVALAAKVAEAHGRNHPELYELRDLVEETRAGLGLHTDVEEQVVFPALKRLEATGPSAETRHVVAGIAALEGDHDDAGAALARMRALTDGFAAPPDACNTYRALLAGLAELELDLHHHVHRENNILFPAALAAERRGWTDPQR